MLGYSGSIALDTHDNAIGTTRRQSLVPTAAMPFVESLADRGARVLHSDTFDAVEDALKKRVGDITNLNGLAWSPNGRTMHWSDTKAHTIFAADFDPASGKVTGMFITGQDHGTEDTGNLIHSLSCHNPNIVFIGSASMWDVQKVTVK